MTMVRIEINCDGSALHDDIIGELGRILSTVPSKIEQQLERSGRCICEAKEAADKARNASRSVTGSSPGAKPAANKRREGSSYEQDLEEDVKAAVRSVGARA